MASTPSSPAGDPGEDQGARELGHFLRLRTCERAQWEIRALARSMLLQLRESAPEVFSAFGPSCKVLGYCPEGRLSCGHPPKI